MKQFWLVLTDDFPRLVSIIRKDTVVLEGPFPSTRNPPNGWVPCKEAKDALKEYKQTNGLPDILPSFAKKTPAIVPLVKVRRHKVIFADAEETVNK